jgi:hypothetical protein
MSLPSSGAINLGQVQTEFGGSNPIGMNEYYRGGTYVPPSNANSSIPTSGTIRLNNFYSGTINCTLTGSYVLDEQYYPTIPQASITFNVNGTTSYNGSLGSDVYNWCDASANPGSWYEVYVSVNSGTLSGGSATNTWLALSTARNWYKNGTYYTYVSCSIRVRIRHAQTGTVVSDINIDLQTNGV